MLNICQNYNIKLKREIDGKISLYSHCIGCAFKKFATTDTRKISDLL